MHQIMTAISTIIYFTVWGLFYGGVLGFISGTLIFPLGDALFATGWGAGIGFILGIVAGTITAFAQFGVQLRNDADFRFFRRSLSFVVGVITAMAAPILIVLTSEGILWYQDYYNDGISFALWVYPVTIAAAMWGYLAAAHATSRSVDLFVGESYKRPPVLPQAAGDVKFWVEHMASKGWLHFLIGMGAGAFNYLNTQGMRYPDTISSIEALGLFALGVFGGALASVIASLLLGTANAMFVTFLNRLIFYEYIPQMSWATYRRLIRLIAFFFTLCVGVVVSVVVFAPLMAVAASIVARDYADQYWGDADQQPEFIRHTYDPDNLFLPAEEGEQPRRVHVRKA